MQAVTTNQFNQLMTGTHIIDFWAEWCGPCRAIHPLLERLEQEHGVTVYKVNVDEEPQLAAQYGIQSIPALVRIEDGRPTKHLVGVKPYPKLVEELLGE